MDDLISRQAAIDAIESHMRSAEEPYYLQDVDRIMNYAFEIAASCIYNLPSAQPDRGYIEQIKWERDLAIRQLADLGYGLGEKPGKWIIVTDSRGRHAECPYCGEWKYHSKQKFCGECGARVEGEEG